MRRAAWVFVVLLLLVGIAGVALALATREEVRAAARVRVDDGPDGAIHLVAGEADPSALERGLDGAGQGGLLTRSGDGWLLSRTLVIDRGASLRLFHTTLRLRSEPGRTVGLEARGGDLQIRDSMVTSWDPTRGTADGNVGDGRAWVLARDGSQMTVVDSTMRMLGYDAYERYGVSWRTEGTGGTIDGATFAGNFFGVYTFRADPMTITDSVIRDSVSYGLDLHTGSDGFDIRGNRFLHNGKHGFILAVDCTSAVVRDNLSVGNGAHGFVVFQGSDHALLDGNDAHDNAGSGFDVSGSTDVRITGNASYENGDGVVVHDRSSEVLVEDNRVAGNASDGIKLASRASATITGNLVDFNRRAGIYLDDGSVRVEGRNRILDNTVGVWFSGGMEAAAIVGNVISSSTDDGIHITDLTPVPRIERNRITDSGKAAFSVSTEGQADRFLAVNALAANDERVRVRGPS